jgi:superfamily II DNA or RNA helicase
VDVALTVASDALDRARNAIAQAMLGEDDHIDAQLGGVILRDHQRIAATRLIALIAANGGAMLAERVGLGKTYVALAVARRWTSRLIVVPASLRDMWRDALAKTAIDAEIVTHEALSRGRTAARTAEIVVIDEAHRLRSPGTHRYAAVADLCARTPVLLLTATPIHNSRHDLAAQLALFLGRSAWQQSEEELTAHVVRDSATNHVRGLPSLDGPHRVTLETDDDCLDDLLALPPAVPAADEGPAAALLTYTLVHQWASSQAALTASLKRRLARTLALRAAIEDGRRPTRRELTAWSFADDALQLAFPGLVASGTADEAPGAAALLTALDRHADAVQSLVARLKATNRIDAERAAALRRLRARHSGERIISFCQYAETVDVLFRDLARDARVAALTSRGARVAGGRLSRREVLAQFMPDGMSATGGSAERIELLLTTDLLSEGLNLQGASVVVHLDLPWNPARLDQRVGRVRRLGSRHSAVTVYTFSPPASTERLLRIEERLREKLCVAQQAVGVAGRILPSPFHALEEQTRPGLAETSGEIRAVLETWRGPAQLVLDTPLAAAVLTSVRGFLAAVEEDRRTLLIADVGDGIHGDVSHMEVALRHAMSRPVDTDPVSLMDALRRIAHWLDGRRGAASVDLRAALTARFRRAALNRVAAALARAPRHRRPVLAPLAAAVRTVVTTALPEGAERVLDTLVRSELPDEAWLRSMAAFGELNAKAPTNTQSIGARVVAIILFCPETSEPR